MTYGVRPNQGFALPTVVVSTVILFMVLVAAVSSVTSVSVALDNQYYQQLAKDAAESGLTQATECLQLSGYTPTWNGSYLRPHSNCSGAPLCIDQAKCFTVVRPSYKVRYYVGNVTDNGDGTMTLSATGVVILIRTSTGAIWKTITYESKAVVGGQVKSQATTFGYAGLSGAFFATLGNDNRLRVAGYNGQGQLGTGDTTNRTTPAVYSVPSTSPIVAAYTNFLSNGLTLHALTASGDVYSTGANAAGQLGNGSTTATQTTPVKFNLPVGKTARSVASLGTSVYVITTDNNIYAAGSCANGVLGSNYTISGCTNQPTPVRVNLPTPVGTDANTLPTDNLVADSSTVYVRMQGGRVYGWGSNDLGQLATGTHTASSTPVKIGTYGDSGQPQALQVATDGVTVYILDDTGTVQSAGYNGFGQSGTAAMRLNLLHANRCLGNNNGDGVTLTFAVCDGSTRQQWLHDANNMLIYSSSASGKCIDNTGVDGYNLGLFTCTLTTSQQFDPIYSGHLRIRLNGKYIDNEGGNLVSAKLYAPSGSINQTITADNPVLMPLKGWANTWVEQVVKISADQWSVSMLTDKGEVWSVGANTSGMFGDGTQLLYNPYPKKFALPAGVHAVDLYNTVNNDPSNTQYDNLYVVGDDGRVYGAGSNVYGQLGNGSTAATVSTPVVMGIVGTVNGRAVSVQAGFGTAVVRTSSGAVYTVGNNSHGQLGDGTTTNRSTPVLGEYLNGAMPTTY